MSDRERRAQLEALQAELARARAETSEEAIVKLRAELEAERRRLERLRAELTQLAPRVMHLSTRQLANRARLPAPVPVPAPADAKVEIVQFKPQREELSPERKAEQVQASVVYVTMVVLVMLSFFCCFAVMLGKH